MQPPSHPAPDRACPRPGAHNPAQPAPAEGRYPRLQLQVEELQQAKAELERRSLEMEKMLAGLVAARARAEENEQRFHAIFDSVNDAIFIHETGTGRILEVNSPMCRLFECTREQALSADVGRFSSGTPPFSGADALEWIQKAMAGAPQVFEWHARAYTGRLFWVEVGMRLARLDHHDRILVTVRDITERKQAQDALRASERNYRELVENANSIILRWNPDGRVAFLNEFGQRFFGYGEGELLGRHVVGTIVPAADEQGRDLRPLMDEICNNPPAFARNINENVCRDGRRVWVAWTNRAVFDAQGRLAEVFSVGTDITEQRRAQEALRQARDELEERVRERTSELSIANLALKTESEERLQAVQEIELLHANLQRRAAELAGANARLQELDRLKSEFLATMSHELRTPLNSIIGFTGLLRQGLAGPVNPEQSKQLGMVYSSAKHLLSLINDLLDLSRIEAGKVDLDRRPFEFADVVGEVVESLKPLARQKRISLLTDLPGSGLALVGDQKRAFQVLLNLAANAVKFTDRGEVVISVRHEPEGLEVCVSDTGIGIKPEHMALLFEAFRQVDGSARRVYEGAGLGLHLCRKLLQLMGGSIQAQSRYGHGSRFTFHIPRELPARPPLPEDSAARL